MPWTQTPGVSPYIGDLSNFDPWGYRPGIGAAGRIYKNAALEMFGGKGQAPKDISQIAFLQPGMRALKSQFAGNNALSERALATGDAALANNPMLLAAQRGQLQRESGQDYSRAVSDYVNQASQNVLGGFQNARNAQMSQGLQAAGLGLQGKQGALQGYIDSYKYKPGFSWGGFLGGLAQGGLGMAGKAFGMG